MIQEYHTALITGPTSGIGKQFAIQLAEAGCDQVLVSRDKDTLAELCEMFGEQYGIKTHYIVADLSKPGEPAQVFSEVQTLGMDVDLLVNNAGTHHYNPFSKTQWEDIQSLMDLNLRSVIHLTHLFLPGMVARNKGHILNLGSTGSFVPWPNDAIYGAGKAFILRFSEALAEELRGTGVRVTCLCPGMVDTAFVEKGRLNDTILKRLTAMEPEPVVAAGIRAMQSGKWVHVPGWVNKLIVFFQRFVPRRLLTRLAKWATRPLGYREG